MDVPLEDLPESIQAAVRTLDDLAAPPDEPDEDLVWIQDPTVDKYTWAGLVEIDCGSRLHLCRAACCSMSFPLSLQDLEEGIVRWDPDRPYAIARQEDGRCIHLDGSCGCTVYEHRPLPCRAYDCRSDKRIWLDFENRVPNPELEVGGEGCRDSVTGAGTLGEDPPTNPARRK